MKTPFLIASLFYCCFGLLLSKGRTNQKFFCIFPLTKGKEQLTLTGLNDQVMSATYSPDGKRIASVGGGGRQLTAGEKERYGILD